MRTADRTGVGDGGLDGGLGRGPGRRRHGEGASTRAPRSRTCGSRRRRAASGTPETWTRGDAGPRRKPPGRGVSSPTAHAGSGGRRDPAGRRAGAPASTARPSRLRDRRPHARCAAAVDAATDAGARPVTVAAPVLDDGASRSDWVREDPPFGGPVRGDRRSPEPAGARSTHRRSGHSLLACDLPRVGEAVTRLVADLALQPRRRRRAVPHRCLESSAVAHRRVPHGGAAGRGIRSPRSRQGRARARAARGSRDRGRLGTDDPTTRHRHVGGSDRTAPIRRTMAATPRRSAEEARRQNPPPPHALGRLGRRACASASASRAKTVPIAAHPRSGARTSANGVARPAAPFSAYVAGLVAGRAGGTLEDVADTVAAITELAEGWQSGEPSSATSPPPQEAAGRSERRPPRRRSVTCGSARDRASGTRRHPAALRRARGRGPRRRRHRTRERHPRGRASALRRRLRTPGTRVSRSAGQPPRPFQAVVPSAST